jgi:hypothetical protein
MLQQASVRLKVLLSVISLCCLLLAGYSIYYNHIVLPYGGRACEIQVVGV